MKRNSLKVLSTLGMLGLAGVALVSCGKKDDTTPTPTPEPTETPAYDPTDLIKNYDKSLSGTVKLTYNANYDMDVNANGGTGKLDSFKHKIRSTTTIEMDLGDELYFHASKKAKDLQVSDAETTTDYLIYKSGDKYYYETSSTKAKEVAANEARAKVNEVLQSVTLEQAGSIDLSTLLYNKADMTYLNAQLFCSDSVMGDDHDDYFENVPTYEKTSSNGLKVVYQPEFVGYHTDGGYSDLRNKDAGYAATITVETNNKGQVTSFKNAYNSASLDMPIMTPAPTIILSGERSFTASYGDSITKINSLEHAPSTLKLTDGVKGTYVVYAGSDLQHATPVTDGASLTLGDQLYIQVTPEEGLIVGKVTVNGVAATYNSGFYCVEIVAGQNEISVTCKEAPKTLYVYNGTANKTEMNVNFYDDKTFDITCPGYKNAVAVKGTYTMRGNTLVLTASSINYMVEKNTVIELTISADKSTASTDAFFNGDAVTFTLVTE